MYKLETKELKISESFRKKIDIICQFACVKYKLTQENIISIKNTNLAYVKVKGNDYLLFKDANVVFINGYKYKINLSDLEKHSISIGTSASMAVIILLAGTKGKRKILPNSKVMLHDLLGEAKGKFKDVITEVKEINKLHNKLFGIIKNNTNLTMEQNEENLKNDFWLNSYEALKYGVVDKIICNKE